MDSKGDIEQQDFASSEGPHYDEKGRKFSRFATDGRRISVVDDVFGEIKEGGVDYRSVSILLSVSVATLTIARWDG